MIEKQHFNFLQRANNDSQNISRVSHKQEIFDTCDGSPKEFENNDNIGANPSNQGQFTEK